MHTYFFLVFLVGTLSLQAAETQTSERSKAFGIFDSIFNRSQSVTKTNSANLGDLSSDQITSGLKQALEKGLTTAVNNLGRTNGFLTNLNVRIKTPSQLKTIEQALRRLRQDAIVDEFEASMNHAAEKAVPAGTEVLLHTLSQLTLEDATTLLTSKSPTAVTEFFRQKTETELSQKFLPIVRDATAETGVTSAYKQLISRASFGRFLLPQSTLDIDEYVTSKALDGLFTMVGQEEKRIRENPQARTTELLQKVFGAIMK